MDWISANKPPARGNDRHRLYDRRSHGYVYSLRAYPRLLGGKWMLDDLEPVDRVPECGTGNSPPTETPTTDELTVYTVSALPYFTADPEPGAKWRGTVSVTDNGPTGDGSTTLFIGFNGLVPCGLEMDESTYGLDNTFPDVDNSSLTITCTDNQLRLQGVWCTTDNNFGDVGGAVYTGVYIVVDLTISGGTCCDDDAP